MSMTRAAFVWSAHAAVLLASMNLAIGATRAEGAAEPCLAKPHSAAPQGSHWFYRVDRVSRRHCWYLGSDRKKRTQGVLPTRSSAPKPLSNPTSEVRSGTPVTFIEATTVLAKQWSDLPKSATRAEDDAATASQPQNSEASTWPAVNATHAGTQ